MEGYYLFGLPFIKISINSEEIEFLVDTGFNGSLLLPSRKIHGLNLRRVGFAQYITADGTVMDTNIFSAEIEWFKARREVSVIETHSDFALAGMELLKNAKIILEPSKEVIIIEQSK